MRTPDYSQPFVGWKGLLADREGRLRSPRGTEWPAGEPLVAECDRDPRHVPPHPRCSCGLYTLDSFETLKAHGYNWSLHGEGEQWLVAEINLWGELRKGLVGFRAGKAYPRAIYVPAYLFAVGNAVRERYGVPMRFIDRFTGTLIGRRT